MSCRVALYIKEIIKPKNCQKLCNVTGRNVWGQNDRNGYLLQKFVAVIIIEFFPLNIPWTISRVQEWKFCITFLNDSIQPTFEFNIVNAFQSVDIRRNINFVLTSLISFKNWSSPQLPDASFTGLHIFQISFYWTCKTCQLIFLPNDSHPTLDISRSNSFILPTMQSIIGRNWKGVGSNEMQYLFNDSAFSVS